jgi:hypothetical protein
VCNGCSVALSMPRVPLLSHSSGISNRHRSPSAENTRSLIPPSSYGMRSRMISIPYPGSEYRAPPLSCHSIIIRGPASPSIPRRHRARICPSGTDSAPCFAALVANSCRTIDSGFRAQSDVRTADLGVHSGGVRCELTPDKFCQRHPIPPPRAHTETQTTVTTPGRLSGHSFLRCGDGEEAGQRGPIWC